MEEKVQIEERVIEMLKTVYDPEIPVNVYDLGLIYKIDLADDYTLNVDMTLTAPNCPAADFIVEAIDQTRGWFYTLTVLSTALHNKPAFKNCICTGLLMAEGGQKLSKRLKNYPDPNEVLENIGSESLRWFLVSSPVLKGGNLAVDKEGKEITKASRSALIPLWNAFYFFTLYANAEEYKAKEISGCAKAILFITSTQLAFSV